MTISANIHVHLLWPVFTIQGCTGLKVKNIISWFLLTFCWRLNGKSSRKYYVPYVSVGLNFEPCQITCNWNSFLVSLICFWNHHGGSMIPDLHVLPCFGHMIMNLWNVSVSREMYTFLEVKLWHLRRKTYKVNDIWNKNSAACKQF